MARQVFLPRDMETKLNTLTGLVEEVNGILLYRPKGDCCPLEALFMTGIGSEGHVRSAPKRMEIVNEFFSKNPDYRFIKFHTHSKGTIEKFGNHYAQHFSQGDFDGIQEQLKHDRDFMAMLATPETKILYGIDEPELIVVDNSPIYQNRNRIVSEALNTIARNKGYDISSFRATRR